jgi:ABC-2 type transport system ATP-binding protein
MTTLALNEVVMSYKPNDPVLNAIDFSLEPGSVTGLLGKNGAGKTTLMRIALGLLRSDRGSVKLFGDDAWNARPEVRKRVGYVPQADAPFNWLRVSDSLELMSSFYEDWDPALVRRYLNEWELDPAAYIQDLSRGQRQKVSILMAIGHRPELLVLDEPVAALDPGARRQFLKALVEMNQDLNQTILFSTHITSDVERVAADLAVLHAGRIAFRGELDELKEQCRKLYFTGAPLPESIDEPGIERYYQKGDHASAFVRDWSPERTSALSRSLGCTITAEPLPLEELFLELTSA